MAAGQSAGVLPAAVANKHSCRKIRRTTRKPPAEKTIATGKCRENAMVLN
jgi:hypothetical protein